MSQSIPYQLSQAAVAGLRVGMEEQGVTIKDNPTSLAQIAEGNRVVFVEDWEDGPTDKPGQTEGRTFAFNLGVINRTTADRAGADLDMLQAKQIASAALIKAARELVKSQYLTTFAPPREAVRRYRVEGLDVGGASIVTRIEIDYRTPAAPNPR